MDTTKIKSHLAALGDLNASMRGFENHESVNRAAAAVDTLDQGGLAGLAAELGEQRFGPLVYSLRSIYLELAETRALVDVGRLTDWADAVLSRIGREADQVAPGDAQAENAAAVVPSIPEGAKEFVIFESLARPGYRVACYHMGAGDELFGLDGKPRVMPDSTKWGVVAYFELPAALDLIPSSAMTLPGDEGAPDWATLAPVAVGSSEAREHTSLVIEGHPPAIELVPAAEGAAAVESAPAVESQAGEQG